MKEIAGKTLFLNDPDKEDAVKDDWLTPPEILAPLGKFDLDPCASLNMPWRTAETMWTVEDDGLMRDWPRTARAWMNPPYSACETWIRRLREHGNGIALIFARTETIFFQDDVWPYADGLLFLRGRMRFCKPDGTRGDYSGGAPSVLIAYGDENVASLVQAGFAGALITRTSPQPIPPQLALWDFFAG